MVEARKRYIDSVVTNKKAIKFPAIWIVADGGDPDNLIDGILKQDPDLRKLRVPIKFDLVSTQFAIHYFFESETKLRAFLHNVTDRLEEGGKFIGTTIDSDRLVHKVRQSPNLTIGNDYYQVVFG